MHGWFGISCSLNGLYEEILNREQMESSRCRMPFKMHVGLILYIFGILGSLIVDRCNGRPNLVLIVADDLGYGDLSSYGHPTQEWTAVDRMASEGIRFTQMYAPSVFCTPSRAALLTGRLPVRLGMAGNAPVFLPGHSTGLPKEEVTIAELLQQHGYYTGIVGKWHQGINEFNFQDGRHLPHHHGFEYVGTILPYTLEWVCDQTKFHTSKAKCKRCFLYQNTTIIQQPINLDNLTSAITMDAKAFLYNHAESVKRTDSQDRPFFLYLSLPQTHTPMFNDQRFKGKSKRGVYGDQILEMSWAIDEVVNVLRELNIEDNTLVTFLSDHGPHREMCAEGGSSGPFRGGKNNYLEGGLRIPAIFWWPGTIAAGQVSTVPVSHMDLYATLADFANIPLPPHLTTDSQSLTSILRGDSTQVIHEILYFYIGNIIMAVRYKQFKIHFYTQSVMKDDDYKYHCTDGISSHDLYIDPAWLSPTPLSEPLIYDVEQDPGERFPLQLETRRDVLEQVDRLKDKHSNNLHIPKLQLLHRDYMTDSLIPCCNPPYCVCN